MNNFTFRRCIPMPGVAPTLAMGAIASTPALAAGNAQDRANVRGQFVSFSAGTLQVKHREGQTVSIALAEGFKVAGVTSASTADLKPDAVVSIPATREAKGKLTAQQIVVGNNGIVPPV